MIKKTISYKLTLQPGLKIQGINMPEWISINEKQLQELSFNGEVHWSDWMIDAGMITHIEELMTEVYTVQSVDVKSWIAGEEMSTPSDVINQWVKLKPKRIER